VHELHITLFVADPIWIWTPAADDRRSGSVNLMTAAKQRAERAMTMIARMRIALVASGLLLVPGVPAIAAIPTAYSLQPGTLLSTHTPVTTTCPLSEWHLLIGPHNTVQGTIEEVGTNKAWRLSGTYDSHGTYHLSGQEVDGTGRSAEVDAQVQSDGSMIFRMTNVGDPSECYNRTVYLPWFRNGNDFGVGGGGGGGSGG
jgi:hypothetical protein